MLKYFCDECGLEINSGTGINPEEGIAVMYPEEGIAVMYPEEEQDKIRIDVVEIQNAIIECVEITIDDHGCLSAWLHLDYGNSGQGFGGYALYLPESFNHHKIESVAGHFIFKCMEIAGVTKWSKLVGKTIRVKCDAGRIDAIGHIIEDKWFSPSDDFKNI